MLKCLMKSFFCFAFFLLVMTIPVISAADDHGNDCASATMINVNTSIPGFFDLPEDIDCFHVVAPTNGYLTVYTTGVLDTWGSLEALDGSWGSSSPSGGPGLNFLITRDINLAAGEPCCITVKEENMMTGPYELHVEFKTCTDANPIAINSTLEKNWTLGGCDIYSIEVPCSGDLKVYTTGDTDTRGNLRGFDCSNLESASVGGDNNNFLIERSIGSPDTYYLGVYYPETGPGDGGSYTLHVEFADDHGNDCVNGTTVDVNSTINGSVEFSDDTDCFRVDAPSYGILTVYTTGVTDTKGSLEALDGSWGSSRPSGGPGDNFLVTREIDEPDGETCCISVEGENGATGDYVLHTEFKTCSDADPIALNSTLEKNWSVGGCDFYSFDIPFKGNLRAYTTGDTDTRGELRNSDCSPWAGVSGGGENNNFLIEKDNINSGTYYLGVSYPEIGAGDGGSYTLRLEFQAPNANRMLEWNNNLVADFGDGLYMYGGSQWQQISGSGNLNNMLVWDGKLVADLGAGEGIYYYDGSWHWLTNWGGSSDMMVWDDGSGENLAVDFGQGGGLYYHDGSTWHWMSNKDDVSAMTVWNSNLVVDFGGGSGMSYHDGSSWTWMSNWDDTNDMQVWNDNGTERLVVDFGDGNGVYAYDGAWNWMTNKGDSTAMGVWNDGTEEKLAIGLGGTEGFYAYDGSWQWLSNWGDVSGITEWNNQLVVDFGANGFYTYDGSWNWMSNKGDATHMKLWNSDLVVDFGAGNGTYQYDGAWNWLTNWDDAAEMVIWNDGTDNNLAVDFGAGKGIYYRDGSGWHWATNKSTE